MLIVSAHQSIFQFSASNTPLVVILKLGITGRLRNERVINGSMLLSAPSSYADNFAFSSFSFTVVSGSSDIKPAIGSSSRALILPFSTTAIPPLLSLIAFTATAISSSLQPTVIMLCESWATEVATAPDFSE